MLYYRETSKYISLRLLNVNQLWIMTIPDCFLCSVPDPILGLKEVLRVTKRGGQALFIEHMRSENPRLGALMDLTNPLVVRMMGPNINRRTVQNGQSAGLEISTIENLGIGDIFKLIVARKPGGWEGV